MPSSKPTPERNDAVSDAYHEFLKEIQTHENDKDCSLQRAQRITQQKAHQMLPMRQFLKRLTDLGVYFQHTESYPAGGQKGLPPQRIDVWENESSPSWLPGTSLFLDHPGKLEISIPNPSQVPFEGVVVIRCSTEHPHADLLHRRFTTMNDACMALSKFLSKSTARIDRMPPPISLSKSD